MNTQNNLNSKLRIPRIQSKEKSQFNTMNDFNHFSFDYKNFNCNISNSNSKEKLIETNSNSFKPSLTHIVSVSNINLITRETQTKICNPKIN